MKDIKLIKYIRYKGTPVFIKELAPESLLLSSRRWVCPICKKEIYEDDSICMIVNNLYHFPNLLMHKECSPNESEVYKTLEQIESDYNKYNKLRLIYERS